MTALNVAFYGGSFDPPHMGHVLSAGYVLSTQPIDLVLFVPVSGHAFDKSLSTFENRVEMARLAIEPLTNVEVCSIESELPHPNFTLHTLQALQQRHPHWKLRLMVGSDVFAQRSKWQQFEEVIRIAPPLVLARAGVPGEGAKSLLPEVSSTTVRAMLRHGDPRLADLVPHKVLTYIQTNRLYRAPEAPG